MKRPSRAAAKKAATFRPTLLNLESRITPADYRSITGVGNNLANPDLGAALTQLLRNTTVGYQDGISEPGGAGRPSARLISNIVVAQGSLDLPSQQYLTDFVFQWGQFLDHDMDLTNPGTPADPFNIPVPSGDPILDPTGTGTQQIGLNRSEYDPATGTSLSNPRQQINEITSFIDGSMIYGSDDARAMALRTGVGGMMKTSTGDLLPYNTMGLPNGNPTMLPPDQLFVAGDIRVNEQIALTAIQTLFVREHNYWAGQISAANPSLSDEEIYQQARQIVGAEIQSITYNEFLPAIMGPTGLTPYSGYNPTVDPAVSNAFSTVAFRVGHTMLSSTLLRLGPDGNPIPQGNVSLRDAFFSPDQIVSGGGIDPILRGLASHVQQEVDAKMVDDVRNFLFDGAPVLNAIDLASLNIQRGRDHGMPSYNQMRIDFGLAPVTSFAQITSNVQLQGELQAAYGDVDKIDAWVGGISEDHVSGTSLGPLFTRIWQDQFERARDGDRYFYERVFSGAMLNQIEHTTLADIIRRNTDITNVQDDVFFSRAHQRVQRIIVGADLGGGPNVRVIDTTTGQDVFNFMAYDVSFRGGVRVAMGDVNGDGTPDIITAAGPGGGPHVKVFDGRDLHLIRSFFAYDMNFHGGVTLAVGDVNDDGYADIITGADVGGGPHVRVFSGKDGSDLMSFFAYDPNFRGGVNVAVGDLDGDGHADIVTGAGPGGGPHVEAFSGATGRMILSLIAYDSAFHGGVFVACGDCDGDGRADVVTGAGKGGGPHVKVFTRTGQLLQSFLAFQPMPQQTFNGVRVGCTDFNADGRADLVLGAGTGDPPLIECRDATTLELFDRSNAFDPAFLGGVRVGSAS